MRKCIAQHLLGVACVTTHKNVTQETQQINKIYQSSKNIFKNRLTGSKRKLNLKRAVAFFFLELPFCAIVQPSL